MALYVLAAAHLAWQPAYRPPVFRPLHAVMVAGIPKDGEGELDALARSRKEARAASIRIGPVSVNSAKALKKADDAMAATVGKAVKQREAAAAERRWPI